MGGGRKKKFIDKKAATTYNVVHRSQQDGAFGLEARPSERVLLAQAPVNAARRARVTRAGFADDGYDYERHLRAGGGGVFVGADGSVSKAAALPPEALPGEQELERAVEAVTLDDRLMDADVRDAIIRACARYQRWSEGRHAGGKDVCMATPYSHPKLLLKRQAVFCLEPSGTQPTRKSIADHGAPNASGGPPKPRRASIVPATILAATGAEPRANGVPNGDGGPSPRMAP